MSKSQSNFRKTFMTVTPLSKTIALAVFVLLPLITFFLGMTYQKTLDTINSSTIPTPYLQMK